MMKDNQNRDDLIFVSLACNLLLVIGKGVAGILANSHALIADAFHSMTDVTAFFINYRACRDCEIYDRIGGNGSNGRIKEQIAETEMWATYCMGLVLFTVGTAICLCHLVMLILNKVEKSGFITVIVASIVLLVYAGIYRYTVNTGSDAAQACPRTTRNALWQNKMNLVSGTVVLAGLIAAMFGFVFMDEIAAVLVGSILVGMGVKLIMEAACNFDPTMKKYSRPVIAGSILTSILLAGISVSLQL